MNNARMIDFVKRWRSIERRQKDLDFERSAWARDLRAECESDRDFVEWCQREAGMSEPVARELLARVAAASIVTDAKTWDTLGGFAQVRSLAALPTKRAKVDAIEAAKSTGLRLSTIVRRSVPSPDIAPTKAITAKEDAAVLAKFIVAHIPRDRWSPLILTTVARHADISRGVTLRKRAA